jgi:hypothetical protein
MPFGVSQSQDDCDGWATVKQEADGSFVTVHCHTSKQGAIDQMLAISFNEDLEPLGQVDDVEQRDEPSLVAPDFMATSARRGLELHEEGLSGDGLMPATVADARRMVNGEALSEDKWRRISPWIARHIVDLDAIEGDEITAGLVLGVPLARTTSGTLRLQEDDHGLAVVADLDPNNPDAMRVMSALKRGDLSQMSFAFRTVDASFSDDRMVRELREVELFDVSVVTFPPTNAPSQRLGLDSCNKMRVQIT